jgi:hypothetical protein
VLVEAQGQAIHPRGKEKKLVHHHVVQPGDDGDAIAHALHDADLPGLQAIVQVGDQRL